MQDDELLRLTCSEPLNLEEEKANQQSWCADPSKVTFIVCALRPDCSMADAKAGMVGDVNAFLSPFVEEDVEEGASAEANLAADGGRQLSAEIEVMIAETEHRRRGLAREALLLLLHWLLSHVPGITILSVKITDDNLPSLRLFEAIGFAVHKRLTVFEQTELRADVSAVRAACAQHWAEIGAREVRLDDDAHTS